MIHELWMDCVKHNRKIYESVLDISDDRNIKKGK